MDEIASVRNRSGIASDETPPGAAWRGRHDGASQTPDHPADITTTRVRRFASNVLGDPDRVRITQPNTVFATGAMRGALLSDGVIVMAVQARGLRPMDAEPVALPGLHIEGRLAGQSRARELDPPNRTAAISDGMVKVSGMPAATRWHVTIPSQSSLESVTVVYPRTYFDGLSAIEPALARQAMALIDSGKSQTLENRNHHRLAFVRVLHTDPEQPGAKLRLEALARGILADTLSALAGRREPDLSADRQLVAHVMDLIEASLAQPRTIAELASAVRVSASRLKRAFQDVLGQPIGAYVAGRRMEAAKGLLGSDLPVSRIAAETGYATPEAFARAFRRHSGMSPRAYRARYA